MRVKQKGLLKGEKDDRVKKTVRSLLGPARSYLLLRFHRPLAVISPATADFSRLTSQFARHAFCHRSLALSFCNIQFRFVYSKNSNAQTPRHHRPWICLTGRTILDKAIRNISAQTIIRIASVAHIVLLAHTAQDYRRRHEEYI